MGFGISYVILIGDGPLGIMSQCNKVHTRSSGRITNYVCHMCKWLFLCDKGTSSSTPALVSFHIFNSMEKGKGRY